MKLHTREWGDGDRTAVLVHGIMSDHRTWRRVGPALADRGYRVVGVDLRGHGASGRGAYSAESWAGDLVETLPHAPDLALGHSLGGTALGLAVERLAPARAVYADPAWALDPGGDPAAFTEFRHATRDMVTTLNPRWADADVDVELATLADWDPQTAHAVFGTNAFSRAPQRAAVPSLVLAAATGSLVTPALRAELTQRGFDVRTVAGTGHSIHRDDFDGFMAALDGWL